MITLYGFGPAFGLPDPSPFVMKAAVLLKMAGQPYRFETGNRNKAPKGKIPYIDDDGTVIGDSTFIRFHLEKKYGFDFDKGLTLEQKGGAWAAEKLCEDHLYWTVVDSRWMNAGNFDKGPRKFFDAAPAPIRPLVIHMIKRQVKRNLWGQGMGRHTRPEIEALGIRGVSALSQMIGDKPFLMGHEPCGADATVFAFIAGGLCDRFDSPIRTAMEALPNLAAYRDRGMARWYGDFSASP